MVRRRPGKKALRSLDYIVSTSSTLAQNFSQTFTDPQGRYRVSKPLISRCLALPTPQSDPDRRAQSAGPASPCRAYLPSQLGCHLPSICHAGGCLIVSRTSLRSGKARSSNDLRSDRRMLTARALALTAGGRKVRFSPDVAELSQTRP